MKLPHALLIVGLAAGPAYPFAFSQAFSGTWNLYVNGYKLELYLQQEGNRISGWMGVNGVNLDHDTISGTVNGNEIRYTRSSPSLAQPQEYHGFLLPHDNPQIEQKRRMTGADAIAGTFSHQGVWNGGWYATRSGPFREERGNSVSSGAITSSAGTAAAPACGLGARWDASENGWTGTWVRRGTSNTFDATWRKDGASGNSVLTMSPTGSRVRIERRDASSFGGAYLEYDVTIASDGTVSGTSRVPATGAASPFRATIHCGDAAGPMPAPSAGVTSAPACGLGVRWDASEAGWTGTWVRRGTGNTFDATWRKDGASGNSVLTMSLTGNRVRIERRDASSFGGAYLEYDVTIAADGTVSGTSQVPATGATSPFRATIHCGDTAKP